MGQTPGRSHVAGVASLCSVSLILRLASDRKGLQIQEKQGFRWPSLTGHGILQKRLGADLEPTPSLRKRCDVGAYVASWEGLAQRLAKVGLRRGDVTDRCPRCGRAGNPGHPGGLCGWCANDTYPGGPPARPLPRGWASSGQWCLLHNCHQDDPNHDYSYPECERHLREATEGEERALTLGAHSAEDVIARLRAYLAVALDVLGTDLEGLRAFNADLPEPPHWGSTLPGEVASPAAGRDGRRGGRASSGRRATGRAPGDVSEEGEEPTRA